VPELIGLLRGGHDVALVSDAGTPAVSDPGGALVAAAWDHGLAVVPVPGPSAVAAALSVAGFPAERFLFAGYVPKKPGRRARFWDWIDLVAETTVIFETPHRIEQTLAEMAGRWPARLMLLGRELTKTYEELARDTTARINEAARGRTWKGEITLVLGPPERASKGKESEDQDV
jgi:16S rRNA (cytidine1402-2'-O)-methyltransferase